MILKKQNRYFLSCDIFILLFEKSHAGGPVHLQINLVSPKYQLIEMALHDKNIVTKSLQ